MTKQAEPEVILRIGYELKVYLPVSEANKVVAALAHGTFVSYRKYEDGVYQEHSTEPPTYTIQNNPQAIQESIEEAALVQLPLETYLKEKNLPHG